MAVTLGKLTYVDLVLLPRTADTELNRFYHRLYDVHNRMSGRVTEDERVITYGDLKTLGLI